MFSAVCPNVSDERQAFPSFNIAATCSSAARLAACSLAKSCCRILIVSPCWTIICPCSRILFPNSFVCYNKNPSDMSDRNKDKATLPNPVFMTIFLWEEITSSDTPPHQGRNVGFVNLLFIKVQNVDVIYFVRYLLSEQWKICGISQSTLRYSTDYTRR